jgi:hypothetical protein
VGEQVFVQLSEEKKIEHRRWVPDTGATNHMTGCGSAFSELGRNIKGTVKFGDESVVQIQGMGTILFQCKNGEHHAFTGVYFIPKLTINMVSVGQLDEGGFKIIIDRGLMVVRDPEGRLLAKVQRSLNHLYILNVEFATLVCLVVKGVEDAWVWHTRFGLLNFPALRKLAWEGMVCGLPEVDHTNQICGGCLAGKHRRTPFRRQTECKAKSPLKLVHGDLCGPILPVTPSGSRYFILLVDDHRR